jgi:hypothetical protein
VQKIRNTRDVAVIVPSHHIAADAYGEASIEDGLPVPDGFELVDAAKPVTRKQLLARAGELGLTGLGRAKNTEIAAAIAAAEAAATVDEADTEPEAATADHEETTD